jgi:hypothetical protein
MTVKIISEILELARTLADNLQNQMLTLVPTLNPRQVNLQYRPIFSDEERIRRAIDADPERVYRNRS